jgi:hypothetical protein
MSSVNKHHIKPKSKSKSKSHSKPKSKSKSHSKPKSKSKSPRTPRTPRKYTKKNIRLNGKYVSNLFNQLYEKYPINILINPKLKNKKLDLNTYDMEIKEHPLYIYESFTNEINKLTELSQDKYLLQKELGMISETQKIDPEVKSVTEGYARGVAQYISSHIKLPYRVSNAFCKLWEIYNMEKDIFPLKPNPSVFYVAEAPGQWIYSSNHYYSTKYANLSKNKEHKYTINWRANTLNPKHPINIKQFGPVFGDDYGFIKNNPDKWIYGEDQTGNIFSVENQRWYRNFAKNFEKFDLVTGDAGLGAINTPLEYLQKLEYACICMVAGISSVGSNCIMKHFLPYGNSLKNSEKANGFWTNYIYMYYLLFDELRLVKPLTSNPNSGEFYVVAKGFRGISDSNYEKLLKVLDNFKQNMCFIPQNDIPDTFVTMIAKFNSIVVKRNINHKLTQNRIYSCKTEKGKTNKDCTVYLNKSLVKKTQTNMFKNWVHHNKFTK